MVLEGLAQDARLAKKGAWADSQPVPLWEMVEEEIALVGRLISWQGAVGFNLRSSQRDKHFLEIIIST